MTDQSRYHRQTLLPEIGTEGQAKLASAHAAIVGVGALGCASSEMLARAGVGRLTLIDRDIVEHTNLQRQTLFTEEDARQGRPKAHAARDRLVSINSEIRIEAHAEDLVPDNAEDLLEEADIIIDGTDNFETRYLLNDLAIQESLPLVIGGAVSTRGTITPILPGHGPCLRCLAPEMPVQHETCDTAGVLGSLVTIIGARQGAIALRILAQGRGRTPAQLEEIDAWAGVYRTLDLAQSRDPDCPCCAHKRFPFLDGRGVTRTTRLCGRGAVQITPNPTRAVDLNRLAAKLSQHGHVQPLEGILRARIESEAIELTIFEGGRAIIKGTEEHERARSLYARYIAG